MATDETVTVGIDTGGTSTEGTDYTDGSGNVDDITLVLVVRQVQSTLHQLMTLFMKEMKLQLFLLDQFQVVEHQRVERNPLL